MGVSVRIEQIGDATLYLGDCREILPSLSASAIVTDPPYGIGWDRQAERDTDRKPGVSLARKSAYTATGWDDSAPDQSVFELMRRSAAHLIIFGGNYFPLPPSRCWLVWDKKTGDNEFADCELAWTNLDKPVRRIEWMWNGMLRRNGETRGLHPSQKPVGVMKWCIEQLPDDCRVILDPFMGSGTTGAACMEMRRRFIGIEAEPSYFEIACRRIEDATRQGDLFYAAD